MREEPATDWTPDPEKTTFTTLAKKTGVEGVKISAIAGLVTAAIVAFNAYTDEDVPVPDPVPVIQDGNMGEVPAEPGAGNETPFHPPQPDNSELAAAIKSLTAAIAEYKPHPPAQSEPPEAQPVQEPPTSGAQQILDETNILRSSIQQLRTDLENASKAAKPKPYTGIIMYVPDPKGVDNGTAEGCPPCHAVAADVYSFGHNWTIGLKSIHQIWLQEITQEDRVRYGYPLFKVLQNGKVVEVFVGYDRLKGGIRQVLSKHPSWKGPKL